MPAGPENDHPWTLCLPSDPLSAARARRFVTGTVGGQVTSEVADAACLVVSELVTNAVRHAEGDVEVVLTLTDDDVRVVVSDAGPGVPVARVPQPDEESGRGLEIVDAVARCWGIEQMRPTGKRVWADVRRG